MPSRLATRSLSFAPALILIFTLTACDRNEPTNASSAPTRVTVTAEAETKVVVPTTRTNQ